jgi:hypothetical protein
LDCTSSKKEDAKCHSAQAEGKDEILDGKVQEKVGQVEKVVGQQRGSFKWPIP